MWYLSMTAGLQEVHKTDLVTILVNMRINQGMSDPGLGFQMNHPVEPTQAKARHHGLTVSKVFLDQFILNANFICCIIQNPQPRILKVLILIVVDHVEANHSVPRSIKCFAGWKPMNPA